MITSGGLGPTADDLTAEVVGRFQGREMKLDPAVEERIAEILRPLAKRFPHIDMEAVRAGQPQTGDGAGGRHGAGPGRHRPGPGGAPARRARDRPTVVVLPGPPRELQPMWGAAVASEAMKAALKGAGQVEQRMLRLFGIPESEIAETLRVAEREGVELGRLEITTCLKRGEVEVVSVFDPAAEDVYGQFEAGRRRAATPTPCSPPTARSVDQQVAALLRAGGPGGRRSADGRHGRVLHRAGCWPPA